MDALALDWSVAVAGLVVGIVVGLTGMGGGALLTPILVLLFNVSPLTAVSNDIIASAFMKPIGGGVHYKSGTVHFPLVRWLVLGSVPAAFMGVWLLTHLTQGEVLEDVVKFALGVALLLVATTLVAREFFRGRGAEQDDLEQVAVKPLRTLMIGVMGGLVVGVTSVGSGSLMMIALLLLYPGLRLRQLVGTDLVQAVPLVASASVAHVLFGHFQFGLTGSILIGALPGVYLGARLSSRAPDHLIRPLLVAVLSASGLKLVGANSRVMTVAGVLLVVGTLSWMLIGNRRARRPAVESSGS